MMSATILDEKAFCRSVGLDADKVKVIKLQSDFPVSHRPIYQMNVAYLKNDSLKLVEVQQKLVKHIDAIMNLHKNHKGIIHTTSYEQLNFIKKGLSLPNMRRLIETNPEIQREEVVKEHVESKKATVLISPSMNTGLDLIDELSRFQILVKVPYPNVSDRWTQAKRSKDKGWYYWRTALDLIQAYGRSIRSKDDWANTYILDSAFKYFVKNNQQILPKWFTDAIRNYP